MTTTGDDQGDLREPRSTGEIVTDAIAVLRQNIGAIVSVAVPFCAVDLVLRELGTSVLLSLTAQAADPNTMSADALLAQAPRFGGAVAFIALAFVVQQLLMGAVTAIGEQAWLGDTPSVGAALRRLLTRAPALLLTSVTFMAVTIGAVVLIIGVPFGLGLFIALETSAFVLAILGLIVGVIGSLSALLVLTLRWSLYGPVVIIEGRSFLGALFRSTALTAPRGLPFADTPRFRLSVLFVVALALSGVLQSLFIVPRLVVAFVTGWSFSDGALPGLAQLPLWFAVPFGLIEVITNAAVIPLSGLLLALFMLDLRLRYDDPASSP